MTFMPTMKDIQEGLEHEDIVIMERAWQLLLTLAEADSAVMRMFDILEVSLRDGVFGPDYIPVVSWIDNAPHRERILLKAILWLYEQGMEFETINLDGWCVQKSSEIIALQNYGIQKIPIDN
jgi:hypothetical protein